MPPAPEAGPSTGCAPPLEVPACARRVTATEVACLVHAYLQGEGYHRATEGFKADAASVLAPVFAAGAPPSVRPLADVLTHYLHLLERESARQACCAGSKLARTLLEVFESHAGAAPLRHLEPLVVLPGFAQPHPAAVPPPPHPLVFAVPPAPARPTFPVHQAPPAAPTRSPHGGRKPPAPRKRAAPGGGGGAARSVRPAMDRAAAGAVAALPFPPGSFQALLMNGSGQMDPAGFADLINGDDERLLVLGEALAAPLPHLDDLEFFPRLPGTAGGGQGQPFSAAAASAAAHAHIFGNDDASRLHIDDILRAFGSDPAAQEILAPLVAPRPGIAATEPGGGSDVGRGVPGAQWGRQSHGSQAPHARPAVSPFAAAIAEADAHDAAAAAHVEAPAEAAIDDEEGMAPALPDDIDTDAFLETLVY